jgi:hypothetical protein
VIFITGLGKCGTSFVAECFRELGFNPGGGFNPNMNAGWEYPPTHVLCRELLFGPTQARFVTCPQAVRLLEKPISDRNPRPLRQRLLEALPPPEDGIPRVVKSPLLLPLLELWIHAGRVSRVVWPQRSLAQIARSWAAWDPSGLTGIYTEEGEDPAEIQQAALDYGRQACARHGIPVCTFRFPEVLTPGTEDAKLFLGELMFTTGRERSEVGAAVAAVSRPETMRVGR